MDGIEKLSLFAQYMKVEIAEEVRRPTPAAGAGMESPNDCAYSTAGNSISTGQDVSNLPIHLAALPNGQRVPLLKTLLSSACERNCNYCAFRAGRNFRRDRFKPDEMALTFNQLYQKKIVQGMFLSSGLIGGGIRTQDKLLDTAEILRKKLGYQGYLHLKIMPGAEKDQVLRAMQLADRVSINLEGPNDERLAMLAPQKMFMDELLRPLRWIEEIRSTQSPFNGWNHHWPSSTTQFVVGAAGEHDLELLQTSAYLHQTLHLARVYFSGFRPVMDTPMEHQSGVNPWREHRLYQASFLLRDYGFSFEELPFNSSGDLPLEIDPKLAWAQAHLAETPIEINQAGREELLRIPGIGLQSVRAILKARRQNQLRSLDDLKAIGIRPNQAAPFIQMNGRRPPVQLTFF